MSKKIKKIVSIILVFLQINLSFLTSFSPLISSVKAAPASSVSFDFSEENNSLIVKTEPDVEYKYSYYYIYNTYLYGPIVENSDGLLKANSDDSLFLGGASKGAIIEHDFERLVFKISDDSGWLKSYKVTKYSGLVETESEYTTESLEPTDSELEWLKGVENNACENDSLGVLQGRTFIDLTNNGLLLNEDGDHPDNMTNGFKVRLYNQSWEQITDANGEGEVTTPNLTNTDKIAQFKYCGLDLDQTYNVCALTQKDYANSMPGAGVQAVMTDGEWNNDSYSRAITVENQSGMPDEAEVCWQASLDNAHKMAPYLGQGYVEGGTLHIKKYSCANAQVVSKTSFSVGETTYTESQIRPDENGLVSGVSFFDLNNDSFSGCQLQEETEFEVNYQPEDNLGHGQPTGQIIELGSFTTNENGLITLENLKTPGRYEVFEQVSEEGFLGFACYRNGTGHGDISNFGEYALMNEENQAFCIAFNKDLTPPAVPENLGFNSHLPDYSTRPVEISCGGYTNINSISHHWTADSDAVEYQRQWVYPGNDPTIESNWHGEELWSTPYTNYRTFGGNPGTQGLWYVRVKARDEAGNWSDYSQPCAVIYDETAPEATAWSNPTTDFFTRLTDYANGKVDMKFVQNPADDIAYYEYQYRRADLDGSNLGSNLIRMNGVSCNSGICTWRATFNNGAVNAHRFRAVDHAGNKGAWSNWNDVNETEFANLSFDQLEYQDYIDGTGIFSEGLVTNSVF